MNKIFLDFESYYDREYSLTKMTTPEYICDPRFKVLGVAIAINDEPGQWYDTLPNLDWANSEVIAHNNQFDSMILTLHYGIKPAKYGCSLSMSRAILPHAQSHRLAASVEFFKLGAKTDGLTEGSDVVDSKLTDYAINDVELCRKLYNRLLPFFPQSELDLIDVTIRWTVEPTLVANRELLLQAALDAEQERSRIIQTSGIPEPVLTSNKQFAEYLISEGINVPTKISPTTGWPTPALAKGDEEFHALCANHPEYQHIWDARLAAKSNININRPRQFASMTERTPNHGMPMTLKYWGAATGRFSGTDGNVQNMPRKSAVRKALEAPKGHVVVVADSAQIELRLNGWYSKEHLVGDTLAAGKDIYILTASGYYGIPYEFIANPSPERQFGKLLALGCGYGVGAQKFQKMCAVQGKALSDDEAKLAVQSYRKTYPFIVKNWYAHDDIITAMYRGVTLENGPITAKKDSLLLPNGMHLFYPGLEPTEDGWLYNGNITLYNSKCVENVIQALARIVITDQLLAIEREGIRTVSSTHDEILAVCPENEADDVLAKMIEIMSTTPDWANLPDYPTLTLEAEGGYAKNYSK